MTEALNIMLLKYALFYHITAKSQAVIKISGHKLGIKIRTTVRNN